MKQEQHHTRWGRIRAGSWLRESGSSAVLFTGILGATLLLGVSLAFVTGLVLRVVGAQSAADTSALEMADTLSGRLPWPNTGDICSIASDRATTTGVQLSSCFHGTRDARVTYTVYVGPLSLPVKAHAGPPSG